MPSDETNAASSNQPSAGTSTSSASGSTSSASGSTSSASGSSSSSAKATAIITEAKLLEAILAAEGEDSTLTIEDLLQQQEGGFMVEPLSWCPHIECCVSALPEEGVNVTAPCYECGNTEENWLCLSCYKVGCGRFVSQHMLSHGEKESHHLVLSFSDFSVWCYNCQQYVHHQAFTAAKQAAYQNKFNENMPGC